MCRVFGLTDGEKFLEGELLTFNYSGYNFRHFISHHNCGHPPNRMTERSVGLSLADAFLEFAPRDEVIEIGGVTPYYWPHRVSRVCDPADRHALITIRATADALDLTDLIYVLVECVPCPVAVFVWFGIG